MIIGLRRVLPLAVIAAGFLGITPCVALADAPAATPVELPAPPPGKGQVVFYRKPFFSLVPFNWIAREGKTEVCKMEAGTYCVAIVDTGTHTYEVHSEVKNDLTLEVDEGETYYVIGGIAMGLIVNHPTIAPTPKAQFDAISSKLKPIPSLLVAAGSTAPAASSDTPASPAPDMSTAAATSGAPTAPVSAGGATAPAAPK